MGRRIGATIQVAITVSYAISNAHGVSPADNETGWSMSLGQTARVLESLA